VRLVSTEEKDDERRDVCEDVCCREGVLVIGLSDNADKLIPNLIGYSVQPLCIYYHSAPLAN